jgi:hypothetical protein
LRESPRPAALQTSASAKIIHYPEENGNVNGKELQDYGASATI